MSARGSAGYLLLEVAVVSIRMLTYPSLILGADAAAASEQVKGLGRIRKVVMKKERSSGEGRLSQPSLFIFHCIVPWVLPIHEGTWAISHHFSVQHPLKVSQEALLCVS